MWVILVTAVVEKVGTLYDASPLVRKVIEEGAKSLTTEDLTLSDHNDPENQVDCLVDKIFANGKLSLTNEDRRVDNLPEIGKAGYIELETMIVKIDRVPDDESAREIALDRANVIAPDLADKILEIYQRHKQPIIKLPCHQLRLELCWLSDGLLSRLEALSAS